jgi:uncharacterized protein YceK
MARIVRLAGLGLMIAIMLAISGCATARRRSLAAESRAGSLPAAERWANRR